MFPSTQSTSSFIAVMSLLTLLTFCRLAASDKIPMAAIRETDVETVFQQNEHRSGTSQSDCPTCKYPRFSWDTLPVYFHSSLSSELGFPDEALHTIEKFPMVTIEKWQGCYAKDYTTEEEAMIVAAKQIKATNPNISVIVWLDCFRIYANQSLNPDATDQGQQYCINSDHSVFMETHQQYLLKNTSGLPALAKWGNLHIYDHSQTFVQNYWTEMCLNFTKTGFVDGCGCDGSQVRATTRIANISHSIAGAWDKGKIAMMNRTRLSLGDNGVFFGKEPDELGEYMTAVHHDGCDSNNATITTLRNVAARSAAAGVRWLYQCHYNVTNVSVLESQVASFLVGAGEYHYWGSGSWFQKTPDFSSRWYADYFEKPLGNPLSLAAYDSEATMWKRSFASGTQVLFNATSGVGTIHWGKAEF